MKKPVIAAIVGGIILFVWQTLSNTVLNLHHDAIQYTPQQDEVMNLLNSKFTTDGRYFMPNLPKGSSMDEQTKLMENSKNKPWAIISYHTSMETAMGMNMLRTFLVDIVVVWLLCWILLKIPNRKYITIFLASLFTGLIVFLNGPYTDFIWYKDPGINAYLFDALASWGLCGLWLGKWLKNV